MKTGLFLGKNNPNNINATSPLSTILLVHSSFPLNHSLNSGSQTHPFYIFVLTLKCPSLSVVNKLWNRPPKGRVYLCIRDVRVHLIFGLPSKAVFLGNQARFLGNQTRLMRMFAAMHQTYTQRVFSDFVFLSNFIVRFAAPK